MTAEPNPISKETDPTPVQFSWIETPAPIYTQLPLERIRRNQAQVGIVIGKQSLLITDPSESAIATGNKVINTLRVIKQDLQVEPGNEKMPQLDFFGFDYNDPARTLIGIIGYGPVIENFPTYQPHLTVTEKRAMLEKIFTRAQEVAGLNIPLPPESTPEPEPTA